MINDNFQYAKIVMLAKDKSSISEEMLDSLNEITGDSEISEQVCPGTFPCFRDMLTDHLWQCVIYGRSPVHMSGPGRHVAS